MLTHDLIGHPLEGTFPTEPFIDDDPQGILVTGWSWFPLKLLGSHVGHCSRRPLRGLGARALGEQGQAKITEQNLMSASQQHILRLDITMYQSLLMSIL
jgi:hypothetical protein